MSEAIGQSTPCSIPIRPRAEGQIVRIVETLRMHTGPIGYHTLRTEVPGDRDEFILDLTMLVRAGVVTRTAAGRFRLADDARRGMET